MDGLKSRQQVILIGATNKKQCFSGFHFPIMDKDDDDERAVIENPMDMATLLQRIDNQICITLDAFLKDFDIILSNANQKIQPSRLKVLIGDPNIYNSVSCCALVLVLQAKGLAVRFWIVTKGLTDISWFLLCGGFGLIFVFVLTLIRFLCWAVGLYE
ncbi:hypothetical protein LguiA_022038 [Lonicera macranthoides]